MFEIRAIHLLQNVQLVLVESLAKRGLPAGLLDAIGVHTFNLGTRKQRRRGHGYTEPKQDNDSSKHGKGCSK
jgi:hypothetical protein